MFTIFEIYLYNKCREIDEKILKADYRIKCKSNVKFFQGGNVWEIKILKLAKIYYLKK